MIKNIYDSNDVKIYQMLSQSQKETIQSLWQQCKQQHMEAHMSMKQRRVASLIFNRNEISKRYQNKKYINQTMTIVKKIAEYFDKNAMITFGFFFSPSNVKQQKWHRDYQQNYTWIFIPLTEENIQNSTQWIENSAKMKTLKRQYSLEDLKKWNKKVIIKKRVTCDKFCCIKFEKQVIHRGATNTGKFARIGAYIGFFPVGSKFIPNQQKLDMVEYFV